MSIKTFALAAAAVALTAGSASANAFAFGQTVEDASTIELGLVKADNNGVVEIYDFAGGEQGALLGTAPVNAGANADVRIDVGSGYKTDLLAVLVVDGQVVATKDYDVVN